MEAEQITLPNGKTASLATTHTLTSANDSTIKVVPVAAPKPVIFFIGGAGDQESYYFQGTYHNIDHAAAQLVPLLDRVAKGGYVKQALGYNRTRETSDIKENIKALIPKKASPIYIVGHSLGGWNGAHLSTLLANDGYNVEMLVTLDPVGEGFWVWLGSDIYKSKPAPVAKTWINVRANPNQPDQSDSVANFGERWNVTSGPTINATVNLNHWQADRLFITPIQEGKSARDLVFESLSGYLKK